MSRSMTKPTKWPVRPAKTQISLSICSLRCPHEEALGLELPIDRTAMTQIRSTQTDLSLCWAHMSFCWFCHAAAQIWDMLHKVCICVLRFHCVSVPYFEIQYWNTIMTYIVYIIMIRSSLIRVYTVCHSACIIWTHYSLVEPHSSNFRVITTNFWGVRVFRKFTVEWHLVLLMNQLRLCQFLVARETKEAFLMLHISYSSCFQVSICMLIICRHYAAWHKKFEMRKCYSQKFQIFVHFEGGTSLLYKHPAFFETYTKFKGNFHTWCISTSKPVNLKWEDTCSRRF